MNKLARVLNDGWLTKQADRMSSQQIYITERKEKKMIIITICRAAHTINALIKHSPNTHKQTVGQCALAEIPMFLKR